MKRLSVVVSDTNESTHGFGICQAAGIENKRLGWANSARRRACARPRGASNMLALVQPDTQGLTEVSQLAPAAGRIRLTASWGQWPGLGSREETDGETKSL